MKKIITILLSVVLSLGLFTACGGSSNPDADKTIKVAAFKGAYGEEFWADIKTEFEAAYAQEGYKIEYQAKQNISETIDPQIKAGNGPDVIYFPTNQKDVAFTEKLIKTKAILPIDDVLNMTIKGENVTVQEKILPNFLSNNAVRPYARDNHLYMLPLFYSPLGIFYNKALFNADGSDGKYKIPTSWDDIDALKVALDELNEGKAKDDLTYLLAYGNAGYMKEFIFSSVSAKSGTDKLQKLFAYDESYTGSSEFKEVLNKVAGLKGYVYPSSWDIAANYKDNQQALLLNKALLLPCGTWLPTEMEDKQKADGFEYGFTSNFSFTPDGDRYAHAKIEQVYILKQSKKQDIAKAFLSFLFSDKSAKIIAQKAKAIIPTTNAISLAKENNYINQEILSFYDIYEHGAKICVGEFFQSGADGINWNNTFTGNVDKILKPTESFSVDDWQNKIKTDGIKLKAKIK